jgi:hypothetical protein
MRDIMAALFAFWSQFGIPAYAEDMVPPTAEVPYIRYTVSKAPAMNTSIMTAFNYHRQALMGNVERAEMAARIAEAIPQGGVRVPVEGGGFLILRRGSDFQTLYQDPEDAGVIGIRHNIEVYYYTM